MFRRLSVLPLFFIIFVFLFLSSDVGFGIGSATVPLTSDGVGFHRSSQRRIYGRDQVVTGGVSGGDFFRGHVPNSSETDFRRSAGYSDSNSFIRGSSDYSVDYSTPGRLDPYVPISGAVDSHRLNGQLGSRRSNVSSGRDRSQFKLRSLDPRLNNLRDGRLDYYDGPGVLGPVTDDVDRRVDLQARREKLIDDRLRFESEVYLRQEKSLSYEVKSDVNLTEEAASEKAVTDKQLTESLSLGESDQILKPLSPDEARQEAAEMPEMEKLEQKESEELDVLGNSVDETNDAQDEAGDDGNSGKTRRVDINSKRSKELLEKYNKFESYAEEKYQSYITVADEFLRDGEYYNAKDAYEIAGVWKYDNPRAFAGKAYAHLAAGEYLSSSLYLMRAIESSGEYAGKKVDVAALIGSKKLYDKRLAEVKVMYEAGGFYQVAFLYAYLSCQDGDFDKAKECIDSAASKLGQSDAWKCLNDFIEQRTAISN